MLKNMINKVKSALDNTEEIDEKFFAEVIKEIKSGYKEEGLEGKSIAMSGGDTDKANSIYVQLRAEYLQEKAALEYLEAFQREEREKKKKEREKKKKERGEQERLDNDELYQLLLKHSVKNLIKFYQKEIEDLGYRKTSFFSSYGLKKSGKVYHFAFQLKSKKLIIFEPNHYSSPETTFNLDDKADEIIAQLK